MAGRAVAAREARVAPTPAAELACGVKAPKLEAVTEVARPGERRPGESGRPPGERPELVEGRPAKDGL